ncbi:MAG: 30S ribosomal protein S9 [Bdellovibrionales bacterium]|jgi:small subunit ribosomal protein S9|nr:30S ribosomal protein S9 [Bdellovibrionales bacterium]MBK8202015.1 30S ribosomal protein S9 [Bdellovibrionales bacterium]MBK9040488.1 30S ribosomal protein S9 [Bdellovibrionales bacterium]
MANDKVFYATGRRKTSAARVFLKPGTGKITINGKLANEYLTTASGKAAIQVPFSTTDTSGRFDAFVTVKGGGPTGQSEAIRHGLSRALLVADEALRGVLKKAGLLTRDSRKVERKKYGLHGARRRPQYSKR